MRWLVPLFAFSFVCLACWAVSAQEKLQMGVSVDVVPVDSDFAGQDIVIFGAIERAEQAPLHRGEYKVILEVVGAEEEAIVRKKDRIAGIWVNAAAREYKNVPSYYAVLSGEPLADITDPSKLHSLSIGIDNLKVRPAEQNNVEAVLTEGEFSSALRRNREESGLFAEFPQSLQQLSPSLYRATLPLPSVVPIGEHRVRGHLFRNGEKLDQVDVTFEVRKVGFEQFIYDLAHEQSFLYGIICVLLAIFTGWFANVIFRKN